MYGSTGKRARETHGPKRIAQLLFLQPNSHFLRLLRLPLEGSLAAGRWLVVSSMNIRICRSVRCRVNFALILLLRA